MVLLLEHTTCIVVLLHFCSKIKQGEVQAYMSWKCRLIFFSISKYVHAGQRDRNVTPTPGKYGAYTVSTPSSKHPYGIHIRNPNNATACRPFVCNRILVYVTRHKDVLRCATMSTRKAFTIQHQYNRHRGVCNM
jgi:hypothetical protein